MTGLTLISNRLPVRVLTEPDGRIDLRPSDGGLVSALQPIMRARGGAWVGWAGSDGVLGPDATARLSALARPEGYGLLPVSLTRIEQEEFYEGACNRLLWPLLHELHDHTDPRPGDAAIYADVNRLFAEVASAHRPGVVWVHDYHLLLTGRHLRRRLPSARLGFFLHVPFPAPETLHQLGWGADIVSSLAAFDLVGFQTEHDRGNFLEWARQVGPTLAGPGGAAAHLRELEARSGVFRISVDWRQYHDGAGEPHVVARAQALRAELRGRQILLGVDRLDYTKGIPHRLRAYARLLEQAPELRGKVVFVQLAVPSRTGLIAYANVRAEVEAEVRTVNERFGTPDWTPVHYVYGSWSHSELLAWYAAADAAVVTPLRDGMNLVAKEFCAANRGHGVLVLSRYAGAAEELGQDALLVNPRDPAEVAAALHRALTMTPVEREARLRRMQAHLRDHDVHPWAASFLDRLEQAAPRGVVPRLLPRASYGGHSVGRRRERA